MFAGPFSTAPRSPVSPSFSPLGIFHFAPPNSENSPSLVKRRSTPEDRRPSLPYESPPQKPKKAKRPKTMNDLPSVLSSRSPNLEPLQNNEAQFNDPEFATYPSFSNTTFPRRSSFVEKLRTGIRRRSIVSSPTESHQVPGCSESSSWASRRKGSLGGFRRRRGWSEMVNDADAESTSNLVLVELKEHDQSEEGIAVAEDNSEVYEPGDSIALFALEGDGNHDRSGSHHRPRSRERSSGATSRESQSAFGAEDGGRLSSRP